ncbi:MAG: patatin-like phospholipase family protein, partial [Bacteroidales bacterium]|nr:patatin-like phospholipase family protein [Bacteroidales bacterium]
MQNWSQIIYDKNDPSKRSIVERQDDNRYFFNLAFQNLRKMQRSRQGIILGNYLNNLFTEITMGYHDSISFDSLPIPFACVAVNIIDDSQVNLRSGHLATAMRASMSIPGVFSPVTIGDMVLVDGGLKDNFPVDLAKEMGADIIIGVSVRER